MTTGLLNVLKPPGMTSHDVVDFARKLYGLKKIGHTGTLDPSAAGVLPLCLGKATKCAEILGLKDNKEYRVEATFGISTNTQDADGIVEEMQDASWLTEDKIEEALDAFKGKIDQVPPMFSAVRLQGKRLYQLAREGQTVRSMPRQVSIYSLKLIRFGGWGNSNPRVIIHISCSKGTYVRTLIADLGKRLGCGAYTSFLLRTKTGMFELSSSLTLEELNSAYLKGMLNKILIPVDTALAKLPFVIVRPGAVKSVCSGGKLYPAGVVSLPTGLYEDQLIRLKSLQELLAIARVGVEKGVTGNRFVFYPVCVFGDP